MVYFKIYFPDVMIPEYYLKKSILLTYLNNKESFRRITLVWNHLIASSFDVLCAAPTTALLRLREAISKPWLISLFQFYNQQIKEIIFIRITLSFYVFISIIEIPTNKIIHHLKFNNKSTYQLFLKLQRNSCHRYQCLDHILFPNRYALEYRNRSCQLMKSLYVLIHILWLLILFPKFLRLFLLLQYNGQRFSRFF